MKKKDKNYAFRINANDLKKIKLKAKQASMTTTDYITKSALEKEIIIIDGIKPMINELKRIGNNLNQQSLLAHQRIIEQINYEECINYFSNIYSQLLKLNKKVN